ncbi:hypothetical protein JCM24511_02515 [Saitozyma sp. JCM 24511]|nr:hypothetical protein JCM24511_02515 [Saitozyma sp. JCM 24511]
MSKIHPTAVSGFGEGTNDLYDRARPSYPAEAIHTVHSSLTSSGPLTILEPGSGTGIFTRLMLSPPSASYPKWNIGKLIGVEPSAGMRGQWEKSLVKVPQDALMGKDVRVVDGGFDDFSKTGVKKGEVDLVVIAQAWHWCPDHDKAFREIASYLSPTGILAFVWNLESSSAKLQTDLRALYEPYDLGSPQYYKMLWRKGFEVEAYKELFEPPAESHTEWAWGMTEDSLVDRVFSKSFMTPIHLNGQARTDFEASLRKLIREADKEWVDQPNGVFNFKYDTHVVIMRKKP